MQNTILYDWFSVTSKIDSPQTIAEWLGLGGLDWEIIKGAHGYRDRWYNGGISIHYNGRDDMGVWLEMSGQGCRTFESFGHGDWASLFEYILFEDSSYHLTRLDVAYDDHTGVLDIHQLERDTRDLQLVTKWRRVSYEWSHEFRDNIDGICLNYGSPASDVKLRIYDKAAERGFTDGRHWVRAELQLRDDRASAFLAADADLGSKFCGVLRNYIRFVDPGTDSNKWRWPTKWYWERFLGAVEPLRLWSAPGVEYNLGKLESYVYQQAGAAAFTLLEIVGLEEFVRGLRRHSPRLAAKYRQLIAQYRLSEVLPYEQGRGEVQEEDQESGVFPFADGDLL